MSKGKRNRKVEANRGVGSPDHDLLNAPEGTGPGLDQLSPVKDIVHVPPVVTGLGESEGQGHEIVSETSRDPDPGEDPDLTQSTEDIPDLTREERGDPVRIPEGKREVPLI